ncbi:MAG: nitrogenase component 1, partial [Chitinivibrionales bacterium]
NGDDVEAICKKAAKKHGIPVIPVHSEGFRGTKMDGYKAACSALAALVGTGSTQDISPYSINILGDFNIAGETWIIKDYYEQMGIDVVSTITGDGRVGDIKRSHGASLNVVQCSGSMIHLAEHMKEKYGIPYIRVSYFGIEDTARALYAVAEHFDNEQISRRTQEVVRSEIERVMAVIESCRTDLNGKKAAIYVGGAFKAFSLVKSLRMLGMETAVVGSQTGNRQDYQTLAQMCSPETIIVDDANTVELASFVLEKDVDLFIGGVKERPIAYKLGIGFCDHNHERKTALAGFRGMANFAKEVHGTVMSPVWRFTPRRSKRMGV